MKKLVLGLGLAVVMASCVSVNVNKNEAPKTTNQPSLNNTQWVLVEQVKGKTPTLVIEGDKLSGNAGCNNYFGAIVTDSQTGSLITKGIGSTRMACPNMNTEANFLKMLGEANRYAIKNNNLELYKDNLLLLKFMKLEK